MNDGLWYCSTFHHSRVRGAVFGTIHTLVVKLDVDQSERVDFEESSEALRILFDLLRQTRHNNRRPLLVKLFSRITVAQVVALINGLAEFTDQFVAVGEGPSWEVVWVSDMCNMADIVPGGCFETDFTVYNLQAEANRRRHP